MEYVAFDLETTGLEPVMGHKIVEIAALRFNKNGQEIAVFEHFVDPERPIPPEATALHGISDDHVAGKPTIDIILPRFMEFIGGPFDTTLLAHYARFDVGFINHELRNLVMFHTQRLEHQVICTYNLSRRVNGKAVPNHKLGTVARHLGVEVDVQHRALADVRLVKGVFLKMNGGR